MTSFDEVRAASRTAVLMQILGLVGLALDGAYWRTSHGHVLPAYLAAMVIMAALLVALLILRRPPVAASAAADLACTAAILVALWQADDVLAREPRTWIPFQPHKLAVLALALIAPTPSWVGVVTILAYTAASTAHYFVFPAEVRAHLALGEPWGSLAFGAFALGVFVHRKRLLRIEHEAMRAHAEAESLRRLARMSLAVRDLQNTPLQTLRLATALLRRHHPEDSARLDQIDRALERLEALERMLSRYEANVDWSRIDPSFDPAALLEGTDAEPRVAR